MYKVQAAAKQAAWYDDEDDKTYNPFRKARYTRGHLDMQSTGICNVRVRASLPKMVVGNKYSNTLCYSNGNTLDIVI